MITWLISQHGSTCTLYRLLNITGSREETPDEDSVILVKFVVFLPYNETYIDEQMWIGTAVEMGGARVWAAEMQVSVVNTTYSDMVSSSISD